MTSRQQRRRQPDRTTANPVHRELRNDLWWGVKHGLSIAALCALVVAIGSAASPGRELPLGLTTEVAVALYFVLGTCFGALAGILRPYTTTRVGAFIVGSALAFALYGGGVAVFSGILPWQWPWEFTVIMVLAAFAVGGTTAVTYWNRSQRTKSHS